MLCVKILRNDFWLNRPIFRVCFVSVIVIKGGENVDQIDAEMETAHEKWLFTKKKAYVYSYAATSGRMLKFVGVLCDDSHTEHGVMPGGSCYI